MIEFKGYISGEAKKRWQHNNRMFFIKVIGIAWLAIVPSIIVGLLRAGEWIPAGVVASSLVLLIGCAFIPQSKKEKRMLTPKSIVVVGDCITCKTDKAIETKYIDDVKTVKDHGAFYEFIFPFGKVSTNFICQKDLLVKGTLEEFEALFGDKIEKVEK